MQPLKENAAALESVGHGVLQKPSELAALARNLANTRWQEALVESEERYRIIAETAIDAIVTIDEDGEILFVNGSAQRIFGYSPLDMLGRSLTVLVPGYSPAGNRGKYQAREVAGRHQDGHQIPLEVSVGEFTQASKTLATCVLRDISARRRAEEELRGANETLRALIEATPLAIIAFDFSENVSKWNPAAEKMFGWSEEEILGRPLPSSPGESVERLRIIQAVRRGESLTLETVCQRKDGASIDVSISAAPLDGKDGIPAAVVAVITDITERNRLADQLRQAQKMEAVGRLAGGIAHDFNNLLTVIAGYGEMLLNSLAEGGRPRAYAMEVLQAAERAAALTRQLLAFSRRHVERPALLDINPVVVSLSNMLQRLIGEDIELVILPNTEAVTVRADPGQIEQVIINLVVNARDAMPRGGRITIETGVAGLEPGRYASISVTDTGLGMTEKTQGRIFEPFFTTKGQGEGTGLGLSTIYGIVKHNHGDIRVHSEPGKGTTFEVYFPLVDDPPDVVRSSESYALEGGKETILLVEDEAGLRILMQELLERLGYTVLAAASSQEAIGLAGAHLGHVDLLLTDVVMPKASGSELAERLRLVRRGTRVLYMSGYPSETVVQHGVLNTGVAFLEKPFTPETLAKKVREVLSTDLFPVPS
jgi:PAS domain S-box-containing protein